MLVSQWRECIAIKRQWEKGALKHRLISYVTKHNKEYFIDYVWHITDELSKRNIQFQNKYYDEILQFCEDDFDGDALYEQIVYPEHNNRYLKQCYYNLQEKYDKGIITKEEWEKIKESPEFGLGGIDVDDCDI